MTIEERAKEFAMDAHDFDCEGCDTCSKCRDYRMFVDIATKQKAIDIDKACEWLDNYLMEIGYPDDWLRDSLNIKSGKERFRKAMDE